MSPVLFSAVLLLTAVIGAALLLVSLAGANIYDLREAKKKRDFARHPHAARYRRRPLVSVIVQVCNDEAGLEQTVNSLAKSSYRKLEVIIADNASTDNTKKAARSLIAKYPKRRIKLFAGRVACDRRVLAAKAYKAYGKGGLVMTMTAGQTVGKQTLMQAVRHYNSEGGLGTLVFNQRVNSKLSVIGFLQKYELLLRMRSKKLFSLLKTDYAIGGHEDHAALLYKKEAFLGSVNRQKEPARVFYASDVLVYVPAAPSLDTLLRQRYSLQAERLRAWHNRRQLFGTARSGGSKTLAWLAWLRLSYATLTGAVALLAPILFGYFVYVAIRLREPVFFILCLVVVSIVLLLAIWGDEHFQPQEKLAYSAGIPLTYGLFCLFGLLLPLALLMEAAAAVDWRKLASARYELARGTPAT